MRAGGKRFVVVADLPLSTAGASWRLAGRFTFCCWLLWKRFGCLGAENGGKKMVVTIPQANN